MPDAPGLELIRGEIERDCPGAVLATSYDRAQAALLVDPERVLEVLTWLRDQPGHRYDFLSSLHAADYLPNEPRFGVTFYLIAMLFILFDIEVVFLYPIGVILKDADSLLVLGELVTFVVLLLVAFVYVWRKGALDWR